MDRLTIPRHKARRRYLTACLAELPPTKGHGCQLIGDRMRSVSAGSRDLLNVELDHAIALITAAGEHAPCGHHWPILRKRGQGCAVATLGFTFAGESKLLLTPMGRSSAYAKSAGRDLPTDFAVGRIHRQVHHTQRPGHGRWGASICQQSPCPAADSPHPSSCPALTRVADRRRRESATGGDPTAGRGTC